MMRKEPRSHAGSEDLDAARARLAPAAQAEGTLLEMVRGAQAIEPQPEPVTPPRPAAKAREPATEPEQPALAGLVPGHGRYPWRDRRNLVGMK